MGWSVWSTVWYILRPGQRPVVVVGVNRLLSELLDDQIDPVEAEVEEVAPGTGHPRVLPEVSGLDHFSHTDAGVGQFLEVGDGPDAVLPQDLGLPGSDQIEEGHVERIEPGVDLRMPFEIGVTGQLQGHGRVSVGRGLGYGLQIDYSLIAVMRVDQIDVPVKVHVPSVFQGDGIDDRGDQMELHRVDLQRSYQSQELTGLDQTGSLSLFVVFLAVVETTPQRSSDPRTDC